MAPDVDVIWDAPASCPDAATARAEILARISDRPAARELRAMARVQALDDGAWQVEVELRTDEGTAVRTLQAASCEEALTATAVVVAIAVDPAAAAARVPPPPSSEPGAPSPAPPPVEPSAAVEPETAASPSSAPPTEQASPAPAARRAPGDGVARRALDLSLGVRGGLDVGALPSPAGHVAGAVGLVGRRFVVQVGALHRIRTDSSVALPRPAGGRFRLTAAQLLAGPRLAWGAVELPLAAGLELGAIWARGIGEVEPIPVRRSWAAVVASAGIGWAPPAARARRGRTTTSVALQLGVDGVVPLLRPGFTLDEEVDVLTVGSFAIRAWMGVVGRFSL